MGLFFGDQLEVQGRGLGVLFFFSFLFFFSHSFCSAVCRSSPRVLVVGGWVGRHARATVTVLNSDRMRSYLWIEMYFFFFYFLFLGIFRGTFLERDLNPTIGAHIPWYQTGLPRSYVGLYSTICLTPCQAICFEELVEATRQDSRRHL